MKAALVQNYLELYWLCAGGLSVVNVIGTQLRGPIVSTRFSLSMEMSRLARDGTAEPVSRDQILRRERGQGNLHFSCSADHVQDWQPYTVDPYSCYMCDHTCIL